eukprot:scaffold8382_cov26-Tisochrysis_lutea.AAC.5
MQPATIVKNAWPVEVTYRATAEREPAMHADRTELRGPLSVRHFARCHPPRLSDRLQHLHKTHCGNGGLLGYTTD